MRTFLIIGLLLAIVRIPGPGGKGGGGGGGGITVLACGAGSDQSGTSHTSIAATSCSVSTGDVLVVETRVGNGSVTINTPTQSGATATCTLSSGTNSGPLDSGGSFIQLATCPVTAGGTTTVTCNFTSIPFVDCVVGIVRGSTGNVDIAKVSSAYASAATTNNLGTNTFTTAHAAEAIIAGMTYNNNTDTFTAGNIAGSAATLLQTSQSSNTGATGIEYRVLSTTVSAQNASLNISGSENDLVVNAIGVY